MKKQWMAMGMAAAMAGSMMAMNVSAADPIDTKVALITMDSLANYWVSIKNGVEDNIAEQEKNGSKIELTWLAPEAPDNAQQIQKIEAAIADNVNYIVIACNDATACNVALQEALDAGIKIIYVDAPATLEASATYSTDNYQGGVTAGEQMLQLLKDADITEGLIGIIDAQPGVDSCQQRYDGFMSVFEGTDYTFSERQYTLSDIGTAQEMANTLIINNAVAFYGLNNYSTTGASAAVADAKNNGTDVIVVGWDTTDANLEYVEKGTIDVLLAQDPYTMGKMALDAVVAMENGEEVDPTPVDTGVSIITAENVADFK